MQDFGKPFAHEAVHFFHCQLIGGIVRLGDGAVHGAVQHTQHQLTKQRFIANAQRIKIIFHFEVGGVPFLQRAAREKAGVSGAKLAVKALKKAEITTRRANDILRACGYQALPLSDPGVHKDLLKTNQLYRHLHYLEFNEVDEQV